MRYFIIYFQYSDDVGHIRNSLTYDCGDAYPNRNEIMIYLSDYNYASITSIQELNEVDFNNFTK
jgi:hypothetical protein